MIKVYAEIIKEIANKNISDYHTFKSIVEPILIKNNCSLIFNNFKQDNKSVSEIYLVNKNDFAIIGSNSNISNKSAIRNAFISAFSLEITDNVEDLNNFINYKISDSIDGVNPDKISKINELLGKFYLHHGINIDNIKSLFDNQVSNIYHLSSEQIDLLNEEFNSMLNTLKETNLKRLSFVYDIIKTYPDYLKLKTEVNELKEQLKSITDKNHSYIKPFDSSDEISSEELEEYIQLLKKYSYTEKEINRMIDLEDIQNPKKSDLLILFNALIQEAAKNKKENLMGSFLGV